MPEKKCTHAEILKLIRTRPEIAYGHGLAMEIFGNNRCKYPTVNIALGRLKKNGAIVAIEMKNPYLDLEGKRTRRKRIYYKIAS
jgi:DNA-binding PadR family transcriptional regulator